MLPVLYVKLINPITLGRLINYNVLKVYVPNYLQGVRKICKFNLKFSRSKAGKLCIRP